MHAVLMILFARTQSILVERESFFYKKIYYRRKLTFDASEHKRNEFVC